MAAFLNSTRSKGEGRGESSNQRRHRREWTATASAGIPANNPVAQHPLIAFFVIAYAVAWSFWPAASFGAFGPLVAALIVIPLSRGRAGLKEWGLRLIRWRVRWIWYVIALGVPLGVQLVTAALTMATGADVTRVSGSSVLAVIATFALRLINPTDGALGEEPGWRGYAQPGLQGFGYTPLHATAIMAVLIAGWHVPLFFLEDGGLEPSVVVNASVTTAAVTFWYVWLFNRTGGSVLLVLMAHSIEGSIQADGWMYTAAWCAVAVALILADRPAWRRPASAAGLAPDRLVVGRAV